MEGHQPRKKPKSNLPKISTTPLTAEDGLQLHSQTALVAKPKGVVCLVHGYGEHSGRYPHVIDALNQANFDVFTYDHRGHGLSGGKRGYVPRFQQFLDDLNLVLEHAIEHTNNQMPIMLYGHSMGGGIVLNYTLTMPLAQQVTAVLASSPWLTLTNPPPLIKRIGARLLKYAAPKLTLPTGLDPNGISRDPDVVQAYLDDPLVHDRISPELFLGIHAAGRQTFALADNWYKPLLLSHGDDDPVTHFASSVALASQIKKGSPLNTSETDTAELKSWPGAFHELHNELNSEAVIEHHVDWLTGQLG